MIEPGFPVIVGLGIGTMPTQMLEEQRGSTANLQAELWRLFLIGMAVFLLLEAVLILPERQPSGAPDKVTGEIRTRDPVPSAISGGTIGPK